MASLATLAVGWLARREYLRLRRWVRALALRLNRLLDRLDERYFSDFDPHIIPRPEEPDPEPVGDYPSPLESFHDEVLAKLEEGQRATRGASTAEVCSHWGEQDERDAADEQERRRRTLRALEGGRR